MRPRTHARRYCGVSCRRAVEYEVRRVRRRLDRARHDLTRRLELDRVNRGLLSTLRALDGSTWAGDTNAVRSDIDALRRHLHVLLHPRPLPRAVRRDGAALIHHGTEE